MDIKQFQKNREMFPPEKLAAYVGKYVAWSPGGTSILASHDDEFHLARLIQAAGYDSAEVLIAFVSDPDEVLLGGGL
jgi:hypothetical protein